LENRNFGKEKRHLFTVWFVESGSSLSIGASVRTSAVPGCEFCIFFLRAFYPIYLWTLRPASRPWFNSFSAGCRGLGLKLAFPPFKQVLTTASAVKPDGTKWSKSDQE